MTPLPKLIQEVISFYQYRDIWKEKVNKLNKEYDRKIVVMTDPYSDCAVLLFNDRYILPIKGDFYKRLKGDKIFIDVFHGKRTRFRQIEDIKYFLFSSGLNHPNAYRNP
jgi:hypothetical protein